MSVGEKINKALEQVNLSDSFKEDLNKQINFTKKMEEEGILKKQEYNASPLDLTGIQTDVLTTFLVK